MGGREVGTVGGTGGMRRGGKLKRRRATYFGLTGQHKVTHQGNVKARQNASGSLFSTTPYLHSEQE